MQNDHLTIFTKILEKLDNQPGVYRMINKHGQVLYVGKARRLKKRFATYLHVNKLPKRLQRMVYETERVVFIVTQSEEEAFLLEAQLIKEMKPKYNILLRDDKTLPYIQIQEGDFPSILLLRKKTNHTSTVFGPFSSISHVKKIIDGLTKIFLIRTCSDHYFNSRTRPCLQYQIKRCAAPCMDLIQKKDYQENIQKAISFLKGKNTQLTNQLSEEMKSAAQELKFEQAAQIRDQIKALSMIQTHQLIHIKEIEYADIIALVRHNNQICIQVFFIRGHHMCGNIPFFFTEEISNNALLHTFLLQFYQSHSVPKKIFISDAPDEKAMLERALKTKITIPKHGESATLVKRTIDNALYALKTHGTSGFSMLENLIKKTITRIEVYDNSHIFSQYSVGAMIVVSNTGFQKNSYRTWNIKKSPGNDCAMIREVLTRRLSNIKYYPDVILIDGGKGQLCTAQQVIQKFSEIPDITLIAIAKGLNRHSGEETLYFTNNPPLKLPKDNPLLHFLQNIRDEAHRFAITTHRKKRDKIRSHLDHIPGLGPKRKKLLLNYFGSIGAILNASPNELIRVPGISKKIAQDIYNYSCCLSSCSLE